MSILKELFYQSLEKSGINYLARKINTNSVLILTYHQVLPYSSKFKQFDYRNVVSKEAFYQQIKFLKAHYDVISLAEAVQLLSEKWQKGNYAVITFDDGYKNNFTYALPVIKDLGVTATFFISTALIDSNDCLWTDWVTYLLLNSSNRTLEIALPDRNFYFELSNADSRIRASFVLRSFLKGSTYEVSQHVLEQMKQQTKQNTSPVEADPDRYAFLTWQEVKAMHAAGMDIGAHTHNHILLSMISDDEVRLELKTSKEAIEKNLGVQCPHFSYPNGGRNDFNERHFSILKELGYHAAVTQIPGVNRVGDNLYSLKRINISSQMTLPVFKAYVSGSYKKR